MPKEDDPLKDDLTKIGTTPTFLCVDNSVDFLSSPTKALISVITPIIDAFKSLNLNLVMMTGWNVLYYDTVIDINI